MQQTPLVSNGCVQQEQSSSPYIPIGSLEWYSWLENTLSFIFEHDVGRFTAHCDVRANGRYWYAYRRCNGKLQKAYLGKTENLTLENLYQAAHKLHPLTQPTPTSHNNASSEPNQSIDPAKAFPHLVLNTKLHAPSPQSHVVQRSRLVDALSEAIQQQQHVLVTAPTGFGKTTLLSLWVKSLEVATFPIEVTWLTLDQRDDELKGFLCYLVAAIQHIRKDVGMMAMQYLLQSGCVDTSEIPLTLLINDLLQSIPLVLVIDDYHVINQQAIHDALLFLLNHAPPSFRLVLASRTMPPLALARLRARNLLAEFHTDHIRLSTDEATQLLEGLTGRSIPPTARSMLWSRTEGWAAALQLTGLTLRNHPNAKQFAETFSGAQSYILDYLIEEVLSHLPDEMATFLFQTSLLQRLSASLCDTVTERSDSQIMLQQIETANLFIIPLDSHRHWYRYHPLFAETLQKQLHTLYPEQIPELHRRASQWYEQQGFIAEAIDHWLNTIDYIHAAGLIETVFFNELLHGRGAEVLHWLSKLPTEMVEQRVRLCLAYAIAYIVDGRYALADPWLARIENNNPDGVSLSLYYLASSHNAYWRGDLHNATSQAQQGLVIAQQALQVPDQPYVEDVQSAIAGLTVILVSAFAAQGQIHATIETARGLLTTAMERNPETLPPNAHSMLAGLHAKLSEAFYEWDDLDAAEYYAQQTIDGGQRSGYSAYKAIGMALLARVQRVRNQLDEAVSLLEEAEHIVYTLNIGDDLHDYVVGWSVITYLQMGKHIKAIQIAQRHNLERAASVYQDHYAVMQKQILQLALARVFFIQGEWQRATMVLEHLAHTAQTSEWVHNDIEIQILRALLSQQQKDIPQALTYLTDALQKAQAGGYIRLFVDEGVPIHTLLTELLTTSHRKTSSPEVTTYVDQLLAALGKDIHRVPQSTNHLISKRERDVLQLLAEGYSNGDIATRLVVTQGTVKRHLHNIYGKLGVSNRTQAILRAQALHLI